MPNEPFHSKPYTPLSGDLVPLLTISIDQLGSKLPLEALADTGCSVGLSLTKEQVELYHIDLGKKLNTDSEPMEIADGTVVGCDLYKCVVELAGERKLVQVTVMDPSKKLQVVEEDKDEDYERFRRIVLLGRDYMNHYDSNFLGHKKKLTFTK